MSAVVRTISAIHSLKKIAKEIKKYHLKMIYLCFYDEKHRRSPVCALSFDIQKCGNWQFDTIDNSYWSFYLESFGSREGYPLYTSHRNYEIHANKSFYLERIYYHIQRLFLNDANSTSNVFILYPED